MPYTPTLNDFLAILGAAWGAGIIAWLVARGRVAPAGTDPAPGLVDQYGLRLALGLWLIGAIAFAALAIVKHEALRSGAFDLGAHHQVVWNLSRGNGFATSIIDNVDVLLGKHFALILVPLAPFLWLWDDARMVLILQAIALTATVIPVYLLARDRQGARLGLAWGVAFLLYPPLLWVNQYDFHEIAFAPVFIGFAIWFLLRRRMWPMAGMLLLALSTREEMGLMVAAFGVYVLAVQRQWRWGLALLVGGFAYTAIVTQLVMPLFYPAGGFLHLERYAYLGDSLPAVALRLVTDPGLVVQTLTFEGRLVFVALLLVPLALAPLLGPEILILALPTLGYTLLSSYPSQWDISSQYHAPLAPVLLAAAIVGVTRLATWQRRRRRPPGRAATAEPSIVMAGPLRARLIGLTAAVVAAAIAGTFTVGPAPLSRAAIAADLRVTERAGVLRAILETIPRGESIALTDRLVPHASNRPRVYLYPWINSPLPPQWLVLDLQSGDVYPFLTRESFNEAVTGLRSGGQYRVIEERDGFLVLRLIEA